jgi:hypothetical protein
MLLRLGRKEPELAGPVFQPFVIDLMEGYLQDLEKQGLLPKGK